MERNESFVKEGNEREKHHDGKGEGEAREQSEQQHMTKKQGRDGERQKKQANQEGSRMGK